MRNSNALRFLLAGLTVPVGCAAIADPTPSDGSEEAAALENPDGDDSPNDDATSAGGSLVVVGSASGGSSMGGAPPSSGSGGSGGTTGPVLLPSCSEDTECQDNNNCTDDACSPTGQCQFVDNETCECTPANASTTCDDDNPCTDDSCAANQCAHLDNTAPCEDDENACTENVCSVGLCTHPNMGLCTDTTVVLRSVRDGNEGQWLSVTEAGLLVWNVAQTGGGAALFERVWLTESTFQLKSLQSELFVTLSDTDRLVATATEETAGVFEVTACPLAESGAVGLSVTTDDDGGNFAAAEPGGEIVARSGGCTPASDAAWERFEILPAGI